jgi:hypothetical protein
MIINQNGELSKGFEILIRQVLKMLNLDPDVTLGQISAIRELLSRHVAQQDEILASLKRIEHDRSSDERNLPDHRIEQRKVNGGT